MRKQQIKPQRHHLWLALVMAAVPAWASAQTELKGSPEELRSFLHPMEHIVTLSAQAEEVAYSDQAIVSLVVKTEDDELAVAIEKNVQLRADIRTVLLDAGIPNKNINNSKFSSSPQYGWFGKEPDSYEVVNRVAITLEQEQQLRVVAGLVDKYDAVSLASTEFKHTQKDDYLTKVKEQALSKVMMQKNVYEDSLNVTLVPINFRDQRVHFAATRGAVALEQSMVSSVENEMANSRKADYASAKPAATSFDETKYTANIAVDFKVETK